MMRPGHESAAAPVAVSAVWGGLSFGLPLVVTGIMGALVFVSCMWPDLDHPRKQGFAAWVVQIVAWRVWMATRTRKDRWKEWGDTHREATHCIEGAAVFGSLATGCTALFLLLADQPSALSYLAVIGMYSPCWGIGVFLGCFSHILADSMTPSGVPFSIIINRLRGYGTWQRWCLGWVWMPTRLRVPLLEWRRWRVGVRWIQVRFPRLTVLRIYGRRKDCEHRGLFKTDSAGERLLARPLLMAAALVLVAAATGVADPIMNGLIEMVFGS